MNKEYIEREEVSKLANKLKSEFAPLHRLVIDAFIYSINSNIPSSDVAKVKHGEWLIVDDLVDENLCNLVCSICGRREFGIENVQKAIEYRPYCHCGAKMDSN